MITIPEILKPYVPSPFEDELHHESFLFPVERDKWQMVCTTLAHQHGLTLFTLTASDERIERGGFRIYAVFGVSKTNYRIIPFLELQQTTEFPSLVSYIHEVSWYERKIHTFFGLTPLGHPHLEPLILHENWPEGVFPLRKDFPWNAQAQSGTPLSYHFQKVEGEGMYEIPVGPVHAGIIEPGHFRFSVAGEEVISLEPRLGYKHKGIEKLFETLALEQKIKLSERVSGDSSFSHALGFSIALERIANIEVSTRAQMLRVIFAELERIANHLNDIGFIMMDTAFNFGGSQCTRLRERMMQWNERLTGNRFLRGVNTLGGVTKDLSHDLQKELMEDLEVLLADYREIIDAAETSSTMLNRLEGAGLLDEKTTKDHGICGVAARALGLAQDARIDFPYATYESLKLPVSLESGGDVRARFYVRVKEVLTSIDLIKQALIKLPEGPLLAQHQGAFDPQSHAVSIVEGWRGPIVYFVMTDQKGEISRVDVRDPSFLNWAAFPYAVQGNVIPDFPLINKSFNLSYSGSDL